MLADMTFSSSGSGLLYGVGLHDDLIDVMHVHACNACNAIAQVLPRSVERMSRCVGWHQP